MRAASPTEPWAAERVVDATLARRLVAEQFPDLAGARVEALGAGWDNTAYVVGGAWVFRFPRREIALPLNARELALLPAIAPRVPLPVPRPERIGRASEAFPWPFAGYRLLAGRTACAADLDDARRALSAATLGRFLAALHSFPAEKAAALGALPDHCGKLDVPWRGRQALDAHAELRARGELTDAVSQGLARAIDDAPIGRLSAPTLVHGDLYARHLLVDDCDRVAGVLDWGDVHLGDRAVDLAIAHLFLPPTAHAAFRAAYGEVDADAWRLARFRAVVHATACLRFGLAVGDADLAREARFSLAWTAGA
jgi:aminoglycoside phosphotransferase (APT) family kinase protein